ncbi:hypothetical protein CLV71_107302 [Actinophytocola oryzae]|uniref:Uncharacterized protein n=1 Tax=Actinophytocola oryzae TaxID=502181 RepID=A0A4R7VKF7_9PSEU|nr:hypothetical protein CLV71_107302 [Actinophytocola oryzae]
MNLRIRRPLLATGRTRTPELTLVVVGIRHGERGPVHRGQQPIPIPPTPGIQSRPRRRYRTDRCLHRTGPQPAPSHSDRPGRGHPTTLPTTTEHRHQDLHRGLIRLRRKQTQRQRGIEHQPGRQRPRPLLPTPVLINNPIHQLHRERPSQPAVFSPTTGTSACRPPATSSRQPCDPAPTNRPSHNWPPCTTGPANTDLPGPTDCSSAATPCSTSSRTRQGIPARRRRTAVPVRTRTHRTAARAVAAPRTPHHRGRRTTAPGREPVHRPRRRPVDRSRDRRTACLRPATHRPRSERCQHPDATGTPRRPARGGRPQQPRDR